MHIRFLAATMIAALLWAGSGIAAPAPVEPSVADPISSPQPAQATPTAQDAEAVALAHGGFTADQITRLHTEVDYDNGILEFEVEFYHGGWEYDYTIHAQTLEILHFHKEYDPPKAQPTKPAQTAPKETQPPETAPPATQPAETTSVETKSAAATPTQSKKITAEEAKAIALQHAGLTAGQVKGLRAEYDRDDGRPEYEVEFRVGNWEYEYEIHAETGKILSWDKEIDD